MTHENGEKDHRWGMTLKDLVIELIEKKETESEEFQRLLRVFGREKLENIWLEYKKNK